MRGASVLGGDGTGTAGPEPAALRWPRHAAPARSWAPHSSAIPPASSPFPYRYGPAGTGWPIAPTRPPQHPAPRHLCLPGRSWGCPLSPTRRLALLPAPSCRAAPGFFLGCEAALWRVLALPSPRAATAGPAAPRSALTASGGHSQAGSVPKPAGLGAGTRKLFCFFFFCPSVLVLEAIKSCRRGSDKGTRLSQRRTKGGATPCPFPSAL